MGIEVLGSDRGKALTILWQEFREQDSSTKYIEGYSQEDQLQFLAVMFADYALDNQEFLKDRMATYKNMRETPTKWAREHGLT